MIQDGRLGVGAVDRVDDFQINHKLYSDVQFYDDVSGKELPEEETVKARQKEMTEVYAHKIYSKVPLQESYVQAKDLSGRNG